jgi:hypothetical protein
MRRQNIVRIAAVAAFACLAGPALADAIDGNWCHQDGRRFTIQGAEIVTPGGKKMEGNYSRHYYSYVPPAPERGAGKPINMTLMNENTVHLRYGENEGPTEVWLRCSQSISLLFGAGGD